MSDIITERVADSPSELAQVLSQFTPHGLHDLKRAQLMNRVDTKFVVPKADLPALLADLQQAFTILEIDGRRLFQYESTYFDTPEFEFYHQHHRGSLNRYKVRFREYRDTQTRYLEVKFKNNKKRTEKNRILISNFEIFDINNYTDYLQDLGVPTCSNLVPKLVNRYERIALASEVRAERLTIDINLENSPAASEGSLALGPLAILELKQAKLNRNSIAYQALRDLQLRPRSFSKYCMGLALTGSSSLKTNRFRKHIRYIQQSLSEVNAPSCLV